MSTKITLISKKTKGIGYASAYLFFSDKKEITIFGFADCVREYVDLNFKDKKCLVNFVYWKKGPRISNWYLFTSYKSRTLEFKSPLDLYSDSSTFSTVNKKRERKFCLSERIFPEEEDILLKLRKIPRKWIPEYDKIIKNLK